MTPVGTIGRALTGPEEGGREFTPNLPRRHRVGKASERAFQLSTIVGIIVLAALLANIVNGAMGYVAVENEVELISD